MEEVDEKFLDLLQRAQSYEGTNSPRKPAPAVCLVAPPFALDAKLAMSLQALLDAKGQIDASAACKASTMAKGTDGRCFPSEIHRENLASAWHASTSSKAKAMEWKPCHFCYSFCLLKIPLVFFCLTGIFEPHSHWH